jgi:hypothetical protein
MSDIPRLALTQKEAAESLGLSLSSFRRHVMPHVRCVRRGSLRIFPATELQRFLDESAEHVLGD